MFHLKCHNFSISLTRANTAATITLSSNFLTQSKVASLADEVQVRRAGESGNINIFSSEEVPCEALTLPGSPCAALSPLGESNRGRSPRHTD